MEAGKSAVLTRITTLEGNELKINRDANDRITSVTDGADRIFTVTMTGGKITQVRDAIGRTVQYGYDGNGNLTSATDVIGANTQFSYDSGHRLVRIDFPNGGVRQYFYKANRVTRRIDEAGVEMRYEYDTEPIQPQVYRSRTNTHIDGRGFRTRYTYNPNGQLIHVSNALGETTSYAYDANNLKIAETDPLGSVWRWEYDQQRNPSRYILPDGRVISYSYNTRGFLLAETNAVGEVTRYVYDTNLRRTKIIYPDGAEEVFGYDSRGLMVSHALPTKPAELTTYNSVGMPDLVTDPNGKVWDYDYNSQNVLTKVTDPIGRVSTMTYDNRGRMTSRTNPDSTTEQWTYTCCGLTDYTDQSGAVWHTDYDLLNRPIRKSDPTGRATEISYDSAGNIASIRLPSGATTTNGYDAANRLTTVTLPQVGDIPSVFRYDYDSAGRMVRLADATGRVTNITVDSTGRMIERLLPDGGRETFTYDGTDRVVSSRDGLGRITKRTYTPRGYLATVQDPRGATVRLAYDSAGWVVKLTDPRNNMTTWTYTNAGDVSAEAAPLGHQIAFIYDNARQLDQRTDARGIVTKYKYDGAGRLVNRIYPTRSETYAYDASGRLLTSRWGADTNFERYSYDPTGRVLTHFQAWVSDTVAYGYDTDGRLASRIGPFGETATFARDAQGRLASLSSFVGNFSWTFDAAGRPTGITRPNGVTTSLSYENVGRIARIKHDTGATALLDILYTYDSGGQIITQVEDTNTITYGYDLAGQLTDADYPGLDLSWTYDDAGNRFTETRNSATTNYTHNAANEMTQAGSENVTYDSAGNMVLRSGGNETFVWDEENRLTRHESGSVVVRLIYADDWRVIARITSGETEVFAYSGMDQAARRNLVTEALVWWLHHPDGIDAVLAESGPAAIAYPLSDHLGSVRGMPTLAGNFPGRIDYEAWGAARVGSVLPELGFTGRPALAGGMNWLRWRHYDPRNGLRFISRDRIQLSRFGVHENFYSYSENSPINYFDPTGEKPSSSAVAKFLKAAIGVVATVGLVEQCVENLFQQAGSGLTGSGIQSILQNQISGQQSAGNSKYGSFTTGAGTGSANGVAGLPSGTEILWVKASPSGPTTVFIIEPSKKGLPVSDWESFQF